ncbi:MAG: S6e family ribosomal protein [Candidatus Micrarchaeaceae archaeon]
MKIVYSDRKTGRSAQADVPKEKESLLIGNSIGDVIDGSVIGLDAYKLQITGLSDKSGTPSMKSIDGSRKVYALMYSKHARKKKGNRIRQLVRGRVVALDTEQINTVIIEYGAKPAEELFKSKQQAEAKEKQ